MRCPSHSIITEGRVRRSFGSSEWHTAQSQPIVGTPIEVALPSTVTVPFFTCEGLPERQVPSALPRAESYSQFPCTSSEAGTPYWSEWLVPALSGCPLSSLPARKSDRSSAAIPRYRRAVPSPSPSLRHTSSPSAPACPAGEQTASSLRRKPSVPFLRCIPSP